MNPYAAKIYIDGSCLKNPNGAGGIAGILEMPDCNNDYDILFQEGYKNTTNNRMELLALIKTLEYIKTKLDKFKNRGVNLIEIYSDSINTINCFYKSEKWKSNKWIGESNNPIKNIDLLKKNIVKMF